MKRNSDYKYNQPTKIKVRGQALRYAVELLTKNRVDAPVVKEDYVSEVYDTLRDSDIPQYRSATNDIKSEDILSWKKLHSDIVGTKAVSDLKVAYLSGPEPKNDFDVFIDLGVRPENIWAFENENYSIKKALSSLQQSKFHGIKFVPVKIEDFLRVHRNASILYILMRVAHFQILTLKQLKL